LTFFYFVLLNLSNGGMRTPGLGSNGEALTITVSHFVFLF